MVKQPPVGQWLLIIEISRSHSRDITFDRTLLGEWSARRRDLYLTTHNTHNRQTSKLPAGFEPTIPGSERPQTHVLDGAATGTGLLKSLAILNYRLTYILVHHNESEFYCIWIKAEFQCKLILERCVQKLTVDRM